MDTAIDVIANDELVIGSGYLDVPGFESEKVQDEVVERKQHELDILIEGTAEPELLNAESIQEKVNEANIIDAPLEIRKALHETESEQITEYIPEIIQEIRVELPETYTEFNLLSVEERAELFAISDGTDAFKVFESVKQYFKEIGHSSSFNEIMDEQIRFMMSADR